MEGAGHDTRSVADRYDLGIAAVYRALAYYHEHPDEMRRVERERERVIEDHRERAIAGPNDLERASGRSPTRTWIIGSSTARHYGHDVEHVDFVCELGKGSADTTIADYSLSTDRLVVTSDDDFLTPFGPEITAASCSSRTND